jgi:hypothetical protein
VIDIIHIVPARLPNNMAFAHFHSIWIDPSRCYPSAALTRQLSLVAGRRNVHSALVRLYKSRLSHGMASEKTHDEAAGQLLRGFLDALPQTTFVALDESAGALRWAFVD